MRKGLDAGSLLLSWGVVVNECHGTVLPMSSYGMRPTKERAEVKAA